MATMSFMPTLKEYLLRSNYIYTVRSFLYDDKPGNVIVLGVGACHRELVKEGIHKSDLWDYFSKSGFSSVDAWWDKIVEINPTIPKLYLYRVEIKRRFV